MSFKINTPIFDVTKNQIIKNVKIRYIGFYNPEMMRRQWCFNYQIFFLTAYRCFYDVFRGHTSHT